jgi:Leucine-rich repeat (LRR) protein
MKKLIISILIISPLLLISGCASPTRPISTSSNQSTPTNDQPAPVAEKPATNNQNKLDLTNQQLTKAPDYIFKLTNLEELNLANNQLTGSLQAEIRQLSNLKTLNLSHNSMTGVPAEIGQLQHLQILDLSNNQLTGLPYELGNLTNLQVLNLSGNNYSALDLNIIQGKLPASVKIIK